jgi:hypothetical protein
VLTEKGKNMVGFLSVELLDAINKCWIIKERLEAGYRMSSDLMNELISSL